MKKIQGQERSWVSAPPTIEANRAAADRDRGPDAECLRPLGALLESGRDDRERRRRDERRAEPWSARDPISIPELVASPSRSEAAVKTTRPKRNSRLRPSRSPARPPSRRKPPKTRVYAFTIHWRFASDRPRSFWIEGSATFTTVASSTTMNWAKQTRTRISQGFVPWRFIGPRTGSDRSFGSA